MWQNSEKEIPLKGALLGERNLAASGLIGKITQEFYKEFYKAQIFSFSPSLHLKMRLICAVSKQKTLNSSFHPKQPVYPSIHPWITCLSLLLIT